MTEPAQAPTAEALRRARMFWEQSQADLKEARSQLRKRANLDSSFLSFQAAINALTSLCYLHGEYRVPNFSTTQLAAKLQGYDPHFEQVEDAARALESVQELNPYRDDRDEAEERKLAKAYYDHGNAILKTVRGYLKTHRKRFFTP